ncbi:MAG: CHAT domain-containing protein, partial [Acidobacteria bacterium]|nr:CHAT domain-containing protein [Acidobacteriota bacterium]
CFDRGKYEQAEVLFKQAFRIWQHAPRAHRSDYLNSAWNLGQLYLRIGHFNQAELRLKQAAKVARHDLAKNPEDLDARRQFIRILIDLARSLQANGRPVKARATYDTALRGEREYIEHELPYESLSSSTASAYLYGMRSLDQLISLVARSKDSSAIQWALNWTLRMKGEAFNVLARFRLLQEISWRPPYLEGGDWRDLQRRLHHFLLNPPKWMDAAAQDREMACLLRLSNRFEGDLNRKVNGMDKVMGGIIDEVGGQDPLKSAAKFDFRTVQGLLPAGSVMINFMQIRPFNFTATRDVSPWQDQRYFAFVISSDPNRAPQLIDVGRSDQVDRIVHDLRDNVRDHVNWRNGHGQDSEDEANYRELAKQLYRLVFTQSGLQGALGGAKTIYLSTDGMLNQVSFDTLVAENGGPYLVERGYAFIYLPSPEQLLTANPVIYPREEKSGLGRGTVIFAAPDYDMSAAEGARQLQDKSEHTGLAADGTSGRSTYRVCDPKNIALEHAAQTQNEADLPEKNKKSESALARGRLSLIPGLGWQILPEMQDEAATVERELQGTPYGPIQRYVGKNALEERFLSMKAPRILHVVTHGFFVPNSKVAADEKQDLEATGWGAPRGLTHLRAVTRDPLLRSGLIFAGANRVAAQDEETAEKLGLDDGWVTAEDVAQMDLRGTELVVLSACESGLGDVQVGEGVQGLQRAFFLAGARSLIMSLNEVPDKETGQLMTEFYHNLIKGENKAAALRNAELALIERRRNEGRSTYPFYWGSFVFLGNAN